MGKSLIIPGADFSENAILNVKTYYFTEGTDYTDVTTMGLITNAYLTNQRLIDTLSGKTINLARICKAEPCTVYLDIAKLPIVGQTSIVTSKHSEFRIVNSITNPTEFTFDALSIETDECLVISVSNTNSLFCNNSREISNTTICYYTPSKTDINFEEAGYVVFGIDFGIN